MYANLTSTTKWDYTVYIIVALVVIEGKKQSATTFNYLLTF